jgi:digeranylgeranylglycerophospholipid reductase
MFDVHVIGAGPAGSFAAIGALQDGKRVLISEEDKQVGTPVRCSGHISVSGLEKMAEHINYGPAVQNHITAAHIRAGKELFVIKNRGGPKSLVLDRGRLDGICADAAVREGATLRLNSKARMPYEADCVIGADGPASSVALSFGFPKISRFVSCFQAEFDYGCDDVHAVEVLLSEKNYPGFFGWIIPLNEEKARIGLGVETPNISSAGFGKMMRELGLDSAKCTSKLSGIIPISSRPKTAGIFGKKKVCLVGDAAGQVKASTGGGIFFASQCGLLAGKYASHPEKYEKGWRAAFGPDMLIHSLIHDAFARSGDGGATLMLSLGKAFMFDALLSECGEMDRASLMVKTSVLQRWISMLSGKKK